MDDGRKRFFNSAFQKINLKKKKKTKQEVLISVLRDTLKTKIVFYSVQWSCFCQNVTRRVVFLCRHPAREDKLQKYSVGLKLKIYFHFVFVQYSMQYDMSTRAQMQDKIVRQEIPMDARKVTCSKAKSLVCISHIHKITFKSFLSLLIP